MSGQLFREATINGEDGTRRVSASGGLHYIRGNAAPHFSLTMQETLNGRDYAGGADHERVLELWPELADLAALHLSDIDGVPMHAEANGWYWLAGALGGLGERYHGGNGVSGKSEAECLAALARHVRVNVDDAAVILLRVQRAYGDPDEEEGGVEARRKRAREEWGRIVDAMRPSWKREAEAAIERHKLEVYGDPWTSPGSGQAIEEQEVRA